MNGWLWVDDIYPSARIEPYQSEHHHGIAYVQFPGGLELRGAQESMREVLQRALDALDHAEKRDLAASRTEKET